MEKILFVYKDKEQKKILNYHEYAVTDNIVCEMLTEYPKIKKMENGYEYYALDDEGNLIVKYEEYPKSEVDLLREENANLHERLCYVQEVDAENVLMINDLQLLVEELQAQITEINNNSGENIEE